MALDLFPRPRSLEMTGPGRGSPITTTVDPSLPPQGYTLRITPDGVEIRHADGAGLRYAEATFTQITEQSTDGMPGVVISDWPDFASRGYMLDISRDRVPTRATLERLVGLCALARINHLELYTEHTFAFRDHEVVWRDASPITPEDVRWLDDLCAANGIELVPNLNCFGHMARWLKHDAYRARAECPDGFEVAAGVRWPPAVLEPTPDNAAFVLDLFAEMLPNFRSRRVNINCDETFELGLGRSRDIVRQQGRERVYVDHIKRIVEPLTAQGYDVNYWADIIRRQPALAAELPPTAMPVCWCYEAPGRRSRETQAVAAMEQLGVDADSFLGFAPNAGPLADLGVPFWVAPGTSGWLSLIGRIDNAQANLLDAADFGAAHRADGYLITDWGDNGHLQPPSVSFGPLVWGGAVAWCRSTNADLDVIDLLDRHVFQDASRSIGAALDEMGRQWSRTGVTTVNSSPLQSALLSHRFGFVDKPPDVDALATMVKSLDASAAAITAARPACVDGDIVQAELVQAARLARHGAWRLLRHAGAPVPADDALRLDLADAIAAQEACWLQRSRPGGLSDSLSGIRRTLARYDGGD